MLPTLLTLYFFLLYTALSNIPSHSIGVGISNTSTQISIAFTGPPLMLIPTSLRLLSGNPSIADNSLTVVSLAILQTPSLVGYVPSISIKILRQGRNPHPQHYLLSSGLSPDVETIPNPRPRLWRYGRAYAFRAAISLPTLHLAKRSVVGLTPYPCGT